jgi:hypothetical protein
MSLTQTPFTGLDVAMYGATLPNIRLAALKRDRTMVYVKVSDAFAAFCESRGYGIARNLSRGVVSLALADRYVDLFGRMLSGTTARKVAPLTLGERNAVRGMRDRLLAAI